MQVSLAWILVGRTSWWDSWPECGQAPSGHHMGTGCVALFDTHPAWQHVSVTRCSGLLVLPEPDGRSAYR